MLIGNPLPYRGLGFTKLDDLIRTVPDLKLINGPKGELVVQTVSNEKGNHLARLVAMQHGSNNSRPSPKASRKLNEVFIIIMALINSCKLILIEINSDQANTALFIFCVCISSNLWLTAIFVF